VKKIVAYFLITFITLSVTAPIAQAVVKPGAKCSKLGDKQDYKSKTYTCVKSKGKLVWDKGVAKPPSSTNSFTDDAADKAAADKAAADKKAAKEAVEHKLIVDKLALVCTSDSNCPLGSTGPGGGMVFYDAGSKKSWGRYLEVVKDGWKVNGDLRVYAEWCRKYDGTTTFSAKNSKPLNIYLTGEVSNPALKATLGVEIGKGKANTDLMLAFCDDERSAAAIARAHKGGGKSDWYLPSKNELMTFCKFLNKADKSAPLGWLTGSVDRAIDVYIDGFYIFRGTPLCQMPPGNNESNWEYDLWSSSEKDAKTAWVYDFYNDTNTTNSKEVRNAIMPVRAFSF
jgi:hypothetical protein